MTSLDCSAKETEKATEIATMSSDCLFKNGGKDIVFLFDCYDELQKDSLVADILKCLLRCYLIVAW